MKKSWRLSETHIRSTGHRRNIFWRFSLDWQKDCQKTADALAQMIRNDGCQMRTGFVGTPYILHVLSNYGYTDLAYTLLCRKEYPSWLYAVGKGATTIWEHWDGIMENGEFWSTDMNSFNHYAYGSVADWIYEQAAGIRVVEEHPGFEKAWIQPKPGDQLEWLGASIETRHGKTVPGGRTQTVRFGMRL